MRRWRWRRCCFGSSYDDQSADFWRRRLTPVFTFFTASLAHLASALAYRARAGIAAVSAGNTCSDPGNA
jgi:hypothetical protein